MPIYEVSTGGKTDMIQAGSMNAAARKFLIRNPRRGYGLLISCREEGKGEEDTHFCSTKKFLQELELDYTINEEAMRELLEGSPEADI